VVALKRTEATSDTVVGQIACYIGWIESELASDKQVHDLIVTQTQVNGSNTRFKH